MTDQHQEHHQTNEVPPTCEPDPSHSLDGVKHERKSRFYAIVDKKAEDGTCTNAVLSARSRHDLKRLIAEDCSVVGVQMVIRGVSLAVRTETKLNF